MVTIALKFTPKFKLAALSTCGTVAAIALTVSSTTAPALSQVKAIATSPQHSAISLFDPPDRGVPTTVGGASRGSELCEKVVPLVPRDRAPNELINPPYFGLTVAAQPTFFWQFQQPEAYAGDPVLFYLDEYNPQTGRFKEVYSTTLRYPETEGVMSFKPPFNLEEGKSYQWSVMMDCEPQDGEVSSIEGLIERVEPTNTLRQALSAAKSPIAQTEAYAREGIWFDALNSLAQERMKADNPELEAAWMQLLQDVDKLEVANTPLIRNQRPQTASGSEERGFTGDDRNPGLDGAPSR
jgi:Domain of Unknown Function (DUF928)